MNKFETWATGIANAIRSKKGTTAMIPAANFESEIKSIGDGGGTDYLGEVVSKKTSLSDFFLNYTGDNIDFFTYDTSHITSMGSMFQSCRALTSIPQLDTSNVTHMGSMFQYCNALTSVPQLNTSKVKSMASMFYECRALISIPQLDTSNATDMSYIFQRCRALTSIPQLDTSNAIYMQGMFGNCSALETIDITYYNISSTSYIGYFVYNCTALKSLIIRGFGSNYVANTDTFTNSGIANGTGYIYVPRAMVDTLKSATNWSTYADQIRALEDYTVDGTTTGALDKSKI